MSRFGLGRCKSVNSAKVPQAHTVTSIGDQLIHEAEYIYKEKGHLTDEIMSALQFVYHTPLLPALDLIDNKAVTMVTAPSGRKLYQITGKPYTCLLMSKYCSCPAYRYSVLLKEEHLLCKHVLALRLSDAMGLTKNIDVSDQEITNMIIQMD